MSTDKVPCQWCKKATIPANLGLFAYHTCSRCGNTTRNLPGEDAKSQKAKGMGFLSNLDYGGQSLCTSRIQQLPVHGILTDETQVKPTWETFGKRPNAQLFVRPCPLTPRHGFVESRVVTSLEQLEQVWKETRAADPEGELMLTDFIEAEMNAILTPTMLTLGEGHDGATGGKHTINFPLHSPVEMANGSILTQAGIGEGCVPYVEAVKKGEIVFLTQLRSGPKMTSASADFIPFPLTITRVLVPDTAKGDLLEWEALIQGVKGEEGVVVNHIGGSPIDHFSVHARSFNIPVIATRAVSVGEVLEPSGAPVIDPESVVRGLLMGERVNLSDQEDRERYLGFALAALHNNGAFSGSQGEWLGIGAAVLLRLGVAALKGESRHLNPTGKPSRESVYSKTLPYSLSRLRAMVPRLIHVLRYGYFSGSIGGEPWAQCGAAVRDLFNAMGALCKTPNTDTLGTFIRAYNNTVHQAHNGGWWMNKFASGYMFEWASENKMGFILNLMETIADVEGMRADPLNTTSRARWETWKPLADLPRVAIREASLTPHLNGAGLCVMVTDALLKKQRRPVTLSTATILDTICKLSGKVFAVQGEHGLRLELRQKGKDVHVLWEDPPLAGSALKAHN